MEAVQAALDAFRAYTRTVIQADRQEHGPLRESTADSTIDAITRCVQRLQAALCSRACMQLHGAECTTLAMARTA
jgi:histidine ammonia-lyase